ncbi:hypothetical protein DBR32_04890 [Taibaiella sp. KBW10]|uniref:hypothetical protein n=1 Tax=Taibaiella sp. KBW10 TaxID=2153357 RepID=UPI000F5B691A|nr:hypothetical protein [Taibaiella sp. KBW10]RQO31303.1 hypothetical protein DBR32_04890 [Taibaiella sp. KBW10]
MKQRAIVMLVCLGVGLVLSSYYSRLTVQNNNSDISFLERQGCMEKPTNPVQDLLTKIVCKHRKLPKATNQPTYNKIQKEHFAVFFAKNECPQIKIPLSGCSEAPAFVVKYSDIISAELTHTHPKQVIIYRKHDNALRYA